jgi:periplasmic divalent cation tolerance protein
MNGFQYCQVVTTTDSRAAADGLARGAVEARLAACAQVLGPITSSYRWEGTIATEEEWQVLLKTTAAAYPALERHLREAHTYDVPEILCLPVTAGSPAYLEWLDTEVGSGPGDVPAVPDP